MKIKWNKNCFLKLNSSIIFRGLFFFFVFRIHLRKAKEDIDRNVALNTIKMEILILKNGSNAQMHSKGNLFNKFTMSFNRWL